MAVYFFDSSALLKRYVREAGTAWVQSFFATGSSHRVAVATIAGVEVVAAIARRFRAGAIASADASQAIHRFSADFSHDFDLIQITPWLIDEAMRLAERHGLRGYDAVQLAALLAADAAARAASQAAGVVSTPVTLISADLELNAAATAEGMPVEDPNMHP